MSDLIGSLLTSEQLQEFAQEHIDWVAKCVAPGDQTDWTPQLWVKVMYPPEKNCEVALEAVSLHVPFSTDEQKLSAMETAGKMFATQRKVPLACAFSCEAWQSTNPPAGMQPKDDPFRREVILVAAVAARPAGQSIVETTLIAHAPFQRINGRMVASEFCPIKTGGSFRPLFWFYEAWAKAGQRVFNQRREPVPSAN